MTIWPDGVLNITAMPVLADNTAAAAAGLRVGDLYRTAAGQLMIAF